MERKHTCEAVVATCIDFRFQELINEWIGENLTSKRKKHDRISFAGGVKDLDTLLNQIKISLDLHETKEVYLINHEDCGAYGQEGTFEGHTRDLHRARDTLLNKYQRLEVYLYFLHLDGVFEEIK